LPGDDEDRLPTAPSRQARGDSWLSAQREPTPGLHIWAGTAPAGLLRTPAGRAAILAGPPESGKTRYVIAPTLACWNGPALSTSTKGDLLAGAARRARFGPVALYDPTGSLGVPEVCIGFSPLGRCSTWDGAVE